MNTDHKNEILSIIDNYNDIVKDTPLVAYRDADEVFTEIEELGVNLTPSRLKNITDAYNESVKPDWVKVLNLVVDIKPRGASRPRAASRGVGVTIYAAPKDTAFKKEFRNLIREETKDIFIEGVISVDMVFYLPFPSNFNLNEKCLAAMGVLRPTVKPDFDNLAKLPIDAMNEMIYSDDVQIVEGLSSKFYSNKPRIELTFHYTNKIFKKATPIPRDTK